ncbi:MAG: class I SAM-dependent methyltransferase [Chitinophagaceae bacterium]
MYTPFQFIIRYLKFRIRAFNSKGHGMHSPFVYSFITEVLNDRTGYNEYKIVEDLRRRLLKDRSPVRVVELGAGSTTGSGNERRVSSIVRTAAKSPGLAQLLFRITRYYQCRNVLELGTSMGISAAYLKLAGSDVNLVTLEGSPQVASRARENLHSLGLQVRIVEGNFDDTLPALLSQPGMIDLVFVDGNHRREPTQRYFTWLLSHMGNDSVIIFDDIHWSPEMEQAWDFIRGHEAVRCSIDLFFVGLVFFRKEFREKLHFEVRF